MVLFNYSTKELTAKIVYYGPGLCGKTTNLQYIHGTLPENVKGKMLSLATKTDRTLFFDFLPIDLGEIRGMKTRVQLYTVPGQVFYNETRKLVLKGADGIVFVADSQQQMLGANVESFKNLEENLKAHGLKLAEMPHVIQFNKRDLPKLAGIEEMNAGINRFNAPFYESVATTGIGVQDTLKAITKLVLLHLTKKYDPRATAAERKAQPAPPVEPVAPPQPAAAAGIVPSIAPDAVPLSEAPAAAVAADVPVAEVSTEAMAAAESSTEERGPLAGFGEDEIEDLVDEVQEADLDPVVAEPTASSMPSFEVDDAGIELEQPRAAAAPPASAVELGAGGGAAAAPPSMEPGRGSFEVDRGIDPDWQPEDDPLTAPVVEELQEVAAEPQLEDREPSLAVETEVSPSSVEEAQPVPLAEPAVDEEPLTLTEVARDGDLFDDPELQVASLGADDEREIVIPVELTGEDSSVRRFKLTLRLRLDPVE
jgi:signal recognition particle receptor subunit beta